MRLHEFFKTAGTSTPAPTKPVSFKIVGIDGENRQQVAEVRAVLVFIPETARAEAERDALIEMRKQYNEHPIPQKKLSDEEVYQVLFRALRTAEDPRVQFAQSVNELRFALTEPVAGQLYVDYLQFLDDEFPPAVDAETFNALVEEARKNSLAVLLTSSKSKQIRRALPGLVNHFTK